MTFFTIRSKNGIFVQVKTWLVNNTEYFKNLFWLSLKQNEERIKLLSLYKFQLATKHTLLQPVSYYLPLSFVIILNVFYLLEGFNRVYVCPKTRTLIMQITLQKERVGSFSFSLSFSFSRQSHCRNQFLKCAPAYAFQKCKSKIVQLPNSFWNASIVAFKDVQNMPNQVWLRSANNIPTSKAVKYQSFAQNWQANEIWCQTNVISQPSKSK